MQNLVFLKQPPEDGSDISGTAGDMYLNRFCINENAAFEVFGVYNLNKRPKKDTYLESTEAKGR